MEEPVRQLQLAPTDELVLTRLGLDPNEGTHQAQNVEHGLTSQNPGSARYGSGGLYINEKIASSIENKALTLTHYLNITVNDFYSGIIVQRVNSLRYLLCQFFKILFSDLGEVW